MADTEGQVVSISTLSAKILAAVHCWDLVHGCQKRDWIVIAADVGLPERASSLVQQYFQDLKRDSRVVFPFPPIPLHDFIPKLPPHESVFDKENKDPKVVDLVKRAAAVLKPDEMNIRQVKYFLGFHAQPIKRELPLADFPSYLKDTLPGSTQDLSMSSDVLTVDREVLDNVMGKLIEEFKLDLGRQTKSIRANKSVRSLDDIAYVRRDLISEGVVMRKVPSDYEFFKVYFYGVLDNFDFEGASNLGWRQFLQSVGIHGVLGWQGRLDFFKFCLPRIGLLRRKLAPGFDNVHFEFKCGAGQEELIDRVIYHSCPSSNKSFGGVMKIIYLMQKHRMISLRQLGGYGVHFCTLRFILRLLSWKTNAVYYTTSETELRTTKDLIAQDIVKNYRYFKFVPKPYDTVARGGGF